MKDDAIRMTIFTESPDLYEPLCSGNSTITVGGHNFACVGVTRKHLSVEAEMKEVRIVSDLPPLESTVRIVPGNTVIWDVAEQFVGVDCRLKAVFMLGDTRMVAVENIGSGQCCCFWASMVRTPEQAKSEERMNKAIALYTAVMSHPGSSLWHRLDSERQEHFLSLVDAGWQQVKP